MSQFVLGVIFLCVSVISLAIQVTALWHLHLWPSSGVHRTEDKVWRGLVRTSVCRVLAAVLYVAMGTTTMIVQQTLPVLALSVFSVVQVLWQGNAVADLRLRRRLTTDTPDPPRGAPNGSRT